MPFPQFYPFVRQIITPQINNRGEFDNGKPLGITVHYSADPVLKRVLKEFQASGLNYHLIIDKDGEVHQTAHLTQRVWHAGEAEWNRQSPNKSHLAVALLGWGLVTPFDKPKGLYKSWNGAVITGDTVLRRRGNQGEQEFYWEFATEAQEDALRKICQWAISTGMSPEDICGHDECALPLGRKCDPGGMLKVTMAELRQELAATAVA